MEEEEEGSGGGSGSGGVSVLTQGRPPPPQAAVTRARASVTDDTLRPQRRPLWLVMSVKHRSGGAGAGARQVGGRRERREWPEGKEGDIEGYGGVCVGVREVKTRVQMKKNLVWGRQVRRTGSTGG